MSSVAVVEVFEDGIGRRKRRVVGKADAGDYVAGVEGDGAAVWMIGGRLLILWGQREPQPVD